MGEIIEFGKFRNKIKNSEITNNKTKSKTTVATSLMRSNGNLYILVGVPCAGKSTYANNFAPNKPNIVIVSTDEIRRDLTGTYQFSLDSNEKVFDVANKAIRGALAAGFDVVFDATNTKQRHRATVIDIAKRYNSKAIAVVFKTPLDICLRRNSKRNSERRVPEEVIVRMAKYIDAVDKSEGFKEVIYIH